MAALLPILSFVFLVMETFFGMVANGSIIVLNFIDWFRNRKLSPTDLILICLGLSRLFQQAVVILEVTLFFLFEHILSNFLLTVIIAWTFTNTMNLCFAACLSVFYLAKIAVFSHLVFLQVKRRLPGLVSWLLLGSVVFSAARPMIVTMSWDYGLFTCNPFKSLSINWSNAEMNIPQVCRNITALNAVFDFIPFMVFLSLSIFLISSLWKHMRCLPRSGTGTRDLNTQAHLSAIKALTSFAVLYVISFAATTSQLALVGNKQYTSPNLLFNVSTLYPSGHGIILILINPKLKRAWVRVLHHLKCHLRKVPS